MGTVIGDTITISSPSGNRTNEPASVKSVTGQKSSDISMAPITPPPTVPPIDQKNEAPANIQFLSFCSFYPAPAEEKVDASDLPIKSFIGDDGSPNNAQGDVFFGRTHLSFRIDDHDGFQEQVIKKAEQLGYTRDSLSNLSVHAAVEVASSITSSQLHYNSKHADTTSLDKESADAIFRKGEGVCRHYAMVNCAVFQVMKDLNPALKNTYMAYFVHSNEIQNVLQHAWNEVINLTKNKTVSTFVDPTWFNRPRPLQIGNLQVPFISFKTPLNAYDREHFGFNYFALDFDIARYYETMGGILYLNDIQDSPKECSEYFIKAVKLYEKVLNKSFDAGLKSIALSNEMRCYCALKEYAKAHSLLDEYVIKYPTDVNKETLWNYLTTVETRTTMDREEKKGLLKMTLQTLKRVRYRATDPGLLSELAKINIEIGDAKTGIEMFREIVNADPKKNWQYLKFAGQCLEHNGYVDESKPFYQEYWELNAKYAMRLNADDK
jgi:tetratricopeptide (TPR) repeat protein